MGAGLDLFTAYCHYIISSLHTFDLVILRAKTAEISLKQCSAYGQIDRDGADREETPIYELPQ